MLIGIVLATVAMVVIGEKTGLPWPALLTVLVMGVVFIPGMPSIEIPADYILPLFLPPLLWSLAWQTSWGVIRDQWITILVLSVLLVIATALGVGAAAYFLMPSFGVLAAIVIGAAVAPPDPVAVEAVSDSAGIPKRIMRALQTEGLFNDAASIVVFHLALTALLQRDELRIGVVLADFVYSAVVAVVVGLGIGYATVFVLERIDNTTARRVLNWVVPFAAYVLAEELGASGVIAVVVAAIQTNSRASFEAEDRLSGQFFWATVDMLFTGIAFGLIGLTLNTAVYEAGMMLWHAVGVGVILALVALVIRFVFMYGFYRLNKHRGKYYAAPMTAREVLLMTWSGMRGLVTLALVLSIPAAVFPAHNELAIIAIVVLVMTMVVPGLLLPELVKWLKVGTGSSARADEMRNLVGLKAREAALGVLRDYRDVLDPETVSVLQYWFDTRLLSSVELNLDATSKREHISDEMVLAHNVRRKAIRAAQDELIQLRNRRGVSPNIVDEVLSEVDQLAVISERLSHHQHH